MRRSRRAVLATGGAALAALAGCSALGLDDDDGPTYDTEALAALGGATLPQPPAGFPVSIPGSMVETHRTRARTLIERVPETPTVPNGVVSQRLRRERQEVVESLAGTGDERDDETEGPLERLGEARNVRGDAAAVAGAYRAATGDISAEAVAGRRERLRQEAGAFDRTWEYRGGDPATALVVHRELDDLRRDVYRNLTPQWAFPPEPTAAAFRVGDIVRGLEGARASLTDADRLRSRYLESRAETRSFATALAVATARLRRRSRRNEARFHEYADPDTERLPFDRNIGGTPLERVYREAAESVQGQDEEATEARRRGALATAALETAREMASHRAFGTIIAAIRDGDLSAPGDVGEIRSAQQRAMARVEAAWEATPSVVAVPVARPAEYLLRDAMDYLGEEGFDESPPDSDDAHRAFGDFVRAAHYADAVPRTMAAVREAYLSTPPDA